MDEERVEMPLTPDIIEPKDGSSRSNSIGRTMTSNSGEKIIPHYLRASTGSCHDICKYGGRHTFLAKENHPILKGKKLASTEAHPITNMSLPARLRVRKTKPSVTSTSSPDPGTQIGSLTKTSKQDAKATKQKALFPGKDLAVVAKSSVALKPKRVAENSPSSPSKPTRDQSVRKGTDEKAGKNSGTSKTGQKKDLMLQKASLQPKASVNNITNSKKEKHQSTKSVSPGKKEHKVKREETKVHIDEKVSEKTLYVIEPKPERKSLGSKGVSPLKSEDKANKDETKIPANEKTLYVVEPKPENQSLKLDTTENGDYASLSSPSTSSSTPSLTLYEKEEYTESEYGGTETDSRENETETDSGRDGSQASKEEYRRRPRRAATGDAEDNDSAHKLKFRRGKVIDPQSENNAPRRLRFRKGRVLGEDQTGKVDVSRQNFKKTEVIDGPPTSEPESEKVVLRHQDVNAKKDSQGLLNKVIEETASKLVEVRMSKVKALVGAFETVISLQEK